MVEILTSFEQMAMRLSPIVLVLPGLIAMALGLVIWLGGLGFKRVLLPPVGALTCAAGAFCLANQRSAVVVLSGLFGAFVGALFQRFFAAVLAAILGAVVAFLILAWPHLRQDDAASLAAENVDSVQERLTTEQSWEVVRVCLVDLADNIKRVAGQLVPARWAVVAFAALGFLVGGLLVRHLSVALSCSILGASLIFLGLVLLLLQKGSIPVTRISSRPGYYVLVFLSMVAFGTTEQWLLCRHVHRRRKVKFKGSGGPGRRESKRSWRSR